MSWAALSIAATLGAGPVLAADSTTAPRPALIYQLPDSKRCGTLTTACDIPKDVNAGGALTSSSINSTNVTATGGVSAPVITAPGGGPIQANVTNAANAQNADKAKDADNATNAVNATKADSAAVATTANNLNPNAVVRGDQVQGAVAEAETAVSLSGGGDILRVAYTSPATGAKVIGLPAVSGAFSGTTLTSKTYQEIVFFDNTPTCTDHGDGTENCSDGGRLAASCQVTTSGTKKVIWKYQYRWGAMIYPVETRSVNVGQPIGSDFSNYKITGCG